MSELKKLGERIKICASKVGGYDSLYDKTGIPVRTLSNYSAGINDIKSAALVSIAGAAGVSLDWLITGEGEPEPNPDAVPVNIPVLTLSASAGDGVYVTEDEEVGGFIQFNQLWLNQMGLNKADLFTIPTVGESMEPTIKAGEYLLCSRAERYRKAGDGIYVIRMNESILVKRLQVMMDDIIVISSDNSLYYKPFKIDLKKNVDFQILGKVILVHGIRWI